MPVYSISIALYEGDEPVLGVVYEINRGEMFYSYQGAPAFLNNNVIHVSQRHKLSDTMLVTGFPYYQFDQQEEYMKLLAELMQQQPCDDHQDYFKDKDEIGRAHV